MRDLKHQLMISNDSPVTKSVLQTNKFFIIISVITCLLVPQISFATSAQKINIGIDATLKRFRNEVSGGNEFLKKATAVLVFPQVIKAGAGIGGEYGEGALRIDNKTVAYYNTAAASVGFQLGLQSKSIVLIFLTKKALSGFRKNEGWKAGVDGSVALVKWGVGEDINTMDIKDPIVGFVFGNKGLMYNLTIEGSKFTKIDR